MMKRIVYAVAAAVLAALLFKVLAPRPCKDCGPKSGLSAVRSALQVYYSDTEGFFPVDDLSSLAAGGRYLPAMPQLWDPGSRGEFPHPPTREVALYSGAQPLADTGKWAYFNDPADKTTWGKFVIDCTHPQVLKGKGLFGASRTGDPWSSF